MAVVWAKVPHIGLSYTHHHDSKNCGDDSEESIMCNPILLNGKFGLKWLIQHSKHGITTREVKMAHMGTINLQGNSIQFFLFPFCFIRILLSTFRVASSFSKMKPSTLLLQYLQPNAKITFSLLLPLFKTVHKRTLDPAGHFVFYFAKAGWECSCDLFSQCWYNVRSCVITNQQKRSRNHKTRSRAGLIFVLYRSS